MNATILDKSDTFRAKTKFLSGVTAPPGSGNGCGRHGGARNAAAGGPRCIAFLDAPNLATLLYPDNDGNGNLAVSAVDLVTLRAALIARFSVHRCNYVVAADDDLRNRSARRRFVERCHWKFVEARRPNMLNRDPVDVLIIESILAEKSQLALTGPRTIVLISHDGGFADACRTFLDFGGRIALVGFVDRFSHKLYALSYHPRCDILDLRYDLCAVTAVPHGTSI